MMTVFCAYASQSSNWQFVPSFLIRTQGDCLPDSIGFSLQYRSNSTDLLTSQDWLNKREKISRRIREQIASWLRTHRSHVVNGTQLEKYSRTNSDQPWEEFCAQMATPGEWMEAPCLIAAQQLYGRTVEVISPATGQDTPLRFEYPGEPTKEQIGAAAHAIGAGHASLSSPGPLRIGNWHRDHFCALVPASHVHQISVKGASTAAVKEWIIHARHQPIGVHPIHRILPQPS